MVNYSFADHAETIRSVMSNISLPESCFPAWANVIPEGEWKAKLVAQISGSVNFQSDSIVGSSSVQDSSSVCAEKDMQGAS